MGRSVRMKSGATSGKSSLSAWPAAVGAAIVSLWFDSGARGVTSCPLHLSSGHVLKEVPIGLLSDVFCPGDICSSETGMYFKRI